MTSNTRASLLAVASSLLLLGEAAIAQSSQATAPPASTAAVTGIQLSFKRDARMVDPYRGIGPWATGSSFTGATAQDTVEVRAEGVGPGGKPAKISPEWIPSDPEMVSVSPTQGDDVKITVHKAGESKLKVTYRGQSQELVVKAQYVGKFILFQIAPPPPAKPNGPAAMEMNPALKDPMAQISYAAGMRLGKTLRTQSVEVDPELVKQAIKDVMAGGPTLMNDDQVQTALMGVETELNVTAATLERKKIAEQNKQAGEQFLAENKKKDGVVTLPSGLQYKVIKAGDGKKPTLDEVAVCHYRGMFLNGTEFDNSYTHRDREPVPFPVRNVMKGWQEALQLMPAGSKWELYVPPDLAYGERGAPRAKIGPNTTLKFDVELLSVEPLDTLARASNTKASAQNTPVPPDVIESLKKLVREATKQEEKPETKVENQ
jgi:FKBP-type peptidyl-prolyl cis-trans isomerase